MSKSNEAVQVLKNLRVYTTYQLKYPVDLADGTTLTEINLRRIKGVDLKAFEDQGIEAKHEYKMVKFFLNRLSHLVYEDIDELDGADITHLSELIANLLTEGKSQKS